MSDRRLPEGLYDLLLTRRVAEKLEQSDHEILDSVDSEETYLYLVRWLAGELQRTLQSLLKTEQSGRQAELCNALLRSIAADSDADESPDEVLLPIQALKEIASMGPTGRPARRAEPLIPLNQSDLLINARAYLREAGHHYEPKEYVLDIDNFTGQEK